MEIIELHRDNFCLKATLVGEGQVVRGTYTEGSAANEELAIVIGSHIYYPRTFSENLKTKLQLVCTDTRGVVPDDPYHTTDDFTIDKITQDIEAIRKEAKRFAEERGKFLDTDKVILIGHSIHAFMALEYASKFPDRVSHLILIASSPIAGPELYKEADQYFEESVCPERKVAYTNSMQKLVESGVYSFTVRMLANGPRLWYNYNFDTRKLWQSMTVNSIGDKIIWGSMFENYDTAASLTAIQCPIFLALGRYDYFNPPHLWEKYRDYASDLTIRIFEKSGHTPQLEEAENFDQELMQWLESSG